MQTALHVLALREEMHTLLAGCEVASTAWYKKERAAYIHFRGDGEKLSLGWLYHPGGWGTFLVPTGKCRVDTGEKPWPFFELEGWSYAGIQSYGLDRIFALNLQKGREKRQVVIECIGGNGNLWLIDNRGTITAMLRNRPGMLGTQYTVTPAANRLDPFTFSTTLFSETTLMVPDMPVDRFLERHLLGWNRTLAQEVLARSGVIQQNSHSLSDANHSKLVSVVSDLAGRFRAVDTAYLYAIAGSWEAYPFKLASQTGDAEKFKSLSLAIKELASRRQAITRDTDTERSIGDLLEKSVEKIRVRIEKLLADVHRASEFESYKKMGELLQSHFTSLKRGMKEITLTDETSSGSVEVRITLDQARSPAENVDAYFRKYRKGREGLELLERRLEVAQAELAELEKIRKAFQDSPDEAAHRYASFLETVGQRPQKSSEKSQVRLPYREMMLSTGVRILVGRDGADNDRTTFDHAQPHDLWFHTAQCPGSHVVLKFPNKSFAPSKREIEETASVAAWFSKARNDSLVPVTYTERRYVRKPRKAKPGLVTVERAKTVMVVPAKPSSE